jgi:hypothetical protein
MVFGLWSKLRSHWVLIFGAQTKSFFSKWESKEIKPFSGSSEQFLSFKNWLSFLTGEATSADGVTAASFPYVG